MAGKQERTAASGRVRQGLRGVARAAGMLALGALLVVTVGACDGGDEDTFTASGVIEAAAVAVTTSTGGRVVTVTVDVGDEVAVGDVLATLDTAAIDPLVDEAQAALDAAAAERDRLEAGTRPEELAVAEAQYALAVARWDGARRAWTNAALAASAPGAAAASPGSAVAASAGGVMAGAAGAAAAQAAVVEAEAAFQQAEGVLRTAQAAVEILREGPTPAELAAAEAAVRQAQAGLEAVQARRDRATLTSPIDGRVLERTVEVGETPLPGAVLLRLTDPATTTLTVYVPEGDVSAVDLRQDVEVEAAAYPDDVFDGEVTAIADEAEFTPKNVQTEEQRSNLVFAVTIAVDNPRERLKPGMSADARFERD